jgi:hypothetical protein
MESTYTIYIALIGSALISAIFAFLGAKLGTRNASRYANSNNSNHDGLDKRLRVHQKAFALSLQIPTAAEDPEKHAEILHECNRFWKDNCLFMLPVARESFRIAYQTAWIFPTYKRQYQERKIDEAEFSAIWNKVTKCTQEIVNAIGMNWPAALEPLANESNYRRRASDWEDENLDRRQKRQKRNKKRSEIFNSRN